MTPPLPFYFKHQNFWLSSHRCLFWEEEKALVLSDPHFGKTGHFRKSGIGVPQNVYQDDLHRLLETIQFFQPRKIIITGDMFHSSTNKEIAYFIRWRSNVSHLTFLLVKGNHDILPAKKYEEAGLELIDHQLTLRNFCFTHDIIGCDKEAAYTFSGHIHPGVKMNGVARQSLRLPCFYFSTDYAVLPAFSYFTGLSTVKPKARDNIFAITESQVIQL